MTSRTTPLGGVHGDEQMLDQLASRSYAGEDHLGLALEAWAKRIDAEASAATARADIGELVRRHTAAATEEAATPTTTIRIRASRVFATLGGIGVAATALGIALANGYNVPGFPMLTPSQSISSITLDQQLLRQAVQIQRVVQTRNLPKPQRAEALRRLAELQQQVKDSAVRKELQSVRAVVEQAFQRTPPPTTHPSASSRTSPANSPSALPTHLTMPSHTPAPTPTTETTPALPTQTTTAPQQSKTTTKPSDASSTSSGIPVSATTTPVPTTTPAPPTSTGTRSTPSSKSTVRSGTRPIPGRGRITATARASSSAPASALAPVTPSTAATDPEGDAGSQAVPEN